MEGGEGEGGEGGIMEGICVRFGGKLLASTCEVVKS